MLPGSFAFFGVSLYVYGAAYTAVPAYLALAIPYAVYHRRWPIKPLLVSVAVLGMVSLPALLYVLINALKWDSIITPWFSIPRLPGVPRFDTVGNFRFWEPRFLSAAANNIGAAARLAVTQNDGLIWNVVPGFGVMYLFSLPLALFGFVLLCRECVRRQFTPAYLILAWCLAAAVLCVFIMPNVNRLNTGMLPLVYCTALGLSWIRERVRGVFYPLLALYGLSFLAFTWTYFTKYPEQAAPSFSSSIIEAIREASKDPHASVCVTNRVKGAYIYVLLANEEDPNEFLRTVRYANPGDEFQRVTSFGRYLFGLPPSDRPDIDVYVIADGELNYPRAMFSAKKIGYFLVLRRKR